MLTVGDVADLAPGDIKRAVSQKRNRFTYEHLGVSELVSNLLERSRTNAGLALELINRPELKNRLDAFVLLFMTAWEQLLKAELERDDPGGIFTGSRTASGRQMTISMNTALERCFPQRTAPLRRNIEVLKDLRDGAAHLLVPEVTGIVTRYFQASILNYIARFLDVAGEPPFRFEGTGLLTLGVPYRSPTLEALQVRHGNTHAAEVFALIQTLEEAAKSSDDPSFVVSLDHRLVLEKGDAPGAIHLTKAPGGRLAVPVHVPKDPKQLCPYTATEVASILSARTDVSWSAGAVAAVAAFIGVKGTDNEFHYSWAQGKATFHSYSDRFIERVQERLRQDPGLIAKAYEARRGRGGKG